MSQVFIPLTWLMGVPSAECGLVAELVALKTIVNEFAAYKKMSTYVAQGLLSVSTWNKKTSWINMKLF